MRQHEWGYRVLVITCFLFVIPVSVRVEAGPGRQVWGEIAVEQELPLDLAVEFNHELRFAGQHPEFRKSIAEIGLAGKVLPQLSLEGIYRHHVKASKTGERIAVGLQVKLKPWRLALHYRLRAQWEREEEEGTERTWRQKLSLRLPRYFHLTPYISFEEFRSSWRQAPVLEKIRLSQGIVWKINGEYSLDLYHLTQRELKEANPGRWNIWGCGIKIDLDW